MDRIKTQVLVVGGGPAGASAAIQCRKNGLECVLVDKAKFPRMKLCGGLLTIKTKDAMLRLLGEDGRQELLDVASVDGTDSFSVFYKYDLLVKCRPTMPMQLVSRLKMDNFLFCKAASLGALTFDDNGLKSIDFEGKIATLSSGQEIAYDYLIATDGAGSHVESLLSRVAKDFKPKKPSSPVVEINARREDTESCKGILGIYFGIMKYGYACVFPRGEYTTVGLAKAYGSKENLKEKLYEFMNGVGVKDPHSYTVKGCQIPYHNVMKNPVWHEHVLFAGDAAGLVDPLTGEGICYAMTSGMNAADAIAASLREGIKPSAMYVDSLEEMRKIIHHGALIEKMFSNFWFMQIFRRKAPRKADFMSFFYDEFIDKGMTDSYLAMKRRWNKVKKNRQNVADLN